LNFKRYIYTGKGNIPVVLSCPHGGFLKPLSIPTRKKGISKPDKNTYFLSKLILFKLKKENLNLYYVFSKIHRSKIDFNRPPRTAVAFEKSSKDAAALHSYYHELILSYADECVEKFGKCLFVDLHGFTKPYKEYPDIIFGNLFGKTLNLSNCSEKPKDYDYWGFYQLKQVLEQHFSLDDGLAIKDQLLAYSGGYITYRFLNKRLTNALQLEIAKEVRTDFSLLNLFANSFCRAIHLILEECK